MQKKRKEKIRKSPAATRLTTTFKWKYESICESLRHRPTCKSAKLPNLRHREFRNGRNTLMNSTECWRECERNNGKRGRFVTMPRTRFVLLLLRSLCYLIPRIIREERSFRRIEAQLDPVLFDESLRKLYDVLTFFVILKILP